MPGIMPERYMAFMSDPSHWRKPDPKYSAWERNVIDEYKQLPNEEIKARVEANRLPYAVLMTHINIDYNLGTVLRIGNCLGAKVYYYGERRWDKRGALGVWHYSPITHLKSIDEVKKLKEEYSFVALEQTSSSVPLPKFNWPKKPLILLGEESCGLQGAPEILELAEHCVEIPQRGSVRSLNAGTAFAIAAYDYTAKLLY
jgi:tRNA G18 (ribose-2'-O)-methylase SpoU